MILIKFIVGVKTYMEVSSETSDTPTSAIKPSQSKKCVSHVHVHTSVLYIRNRYLSLVYNIGVGTGPAGPAAAGPIFLKKLKL